MGVQDSGMSSKISISIICKFIFETEMGLLISANSTKELDVTLY